MKEKQDKKKISALDKYVIFSISVLMIFTAIEMVLASLTGLTHDTLTTCVFASFGGEILSCALIKIFKLRENKDA